MKSHNIKDILEERTMEVSEKSWEQLADRLDAHDNRKKRRNLYPYAACIALLIGLIGFLIGRNVGETQQTIVDTEKTIEIQKDIETEKPTVNDKSIENKVIEEVLVVNEESSKPATIQVQKEESSKEKLTPKQQENSAIALQKEIQKPIAIDSPKVVPVRSVDVVVAAAEKEVKLNDELKASIMALSASEKVAISNEEIDQLLKEAQKSLENLNVKQTLEITNYATADDLLNEVEYELDMSFKQKVFELIKHRFSKTRTAAIDQ